LRNKIKVLRKENWKLGKKNEKLGNLEGVYFLALVSIGK
jgi:hypothetical protein